MSISERERWMADAHNMALAASNKRMPTLIVDVALAIIAFSDVEEDDAVESTL